MIQIRDKIDLEHLQVIGTIQSPELQFAGERFQQVYLKGGLDKGAYRLESIRAEKNGSSWNAYFNLSPNNDIQWWLKTKNLSLEDFDLISSLDFPLRGRMTLVSEGAGPLHQIESRTRISNDAGIIRGRRLEPSFLDIRSSKGSVYLSSSIFGGEGSLDLIYHTDKSLLSSLRATATKLDLTPMILLLNSRLAQDSTLKAQVSGDLKLAFTAGKFELASGSVELDQAYLSKNDRKTELSKPVRMDVREGTFDLKPIAIKSPVGDLWIELSSSKGNLNGRAKGLVDFGLLEYLFSPIERAAGTVECDLGLRGTIKEPNFFGKFKTSDGSVKIRNIEQPIENIDTRFNIDGGSIRSQQFTSLFAGGRLSGSAAIDLFIDRYPKLDVSLFLSGNKLQVFPFQVARIRGRLKIKGDEIPYLVGGDLNVENAISRESFFSGKDIGLKAARYTPPPASIRSSDFPRFKLDINVDAEKNVFIKNEIADAEIKFKLKLTNNIHVPRVLGTAEVIQGRLIFKDRNFTITSANVIFDNPTTLNPKFSLTANTQVNDVKINLFASGSKEDWRINLTSSPAMSEADVLSLLALGVTSQDVRRLRSGSQASLEQGQAANLVLNSLDFNRDVQDKTGLQIQVEEAINTQTATSIFRPQSQADMVAAPKIVIRRRVGKRLQLSLGSTVGVGLGRQQEMNAEVKVNQALSVIGVWNQFQGVDSNQNPSSYGLDLKVQKRFK
jgi:translocation and assembly module TamB